MTRDEIVDLAMEAWITEKEAEMISEYGGYLSCTYLDDLQRFVELVIKHDREQLAKKIEKLPFGDTSQSFAVWVRQQ